MVDPVRPLRMSSCDNQYGSKCNFSCTIGYRLNGSSAVTCVASGNQHPGMWNNTMPTCEGKLKQLFSSYRIPWESFLFFNSSSFTTKIFLLPFMAFSTCSPSRLVTKGILSLKSGLSFDYLSEHIACTKIWRKFFQFFRKNGVLSKESFDLVVH